MSLDATRWAWQQKVKATQKLVLLSLADRADEKHCCFPSIARLTSDTCLDRKTVMSSIKTLEAMGLIIVRKKDGSSNFYQLVGVVDRFREEEKTHCLSSTENGTTKNGTTKKSSTKNGTSTSTKNGTSPVPKTVHKSTNNLSINLPGYIDMDLFMVWWTETRVKKKAVNSETALKLIVKDFEKIHADGFDPNESIEEAIKKGWKSVYPVKRNETNSRFSPKETDILGSHDTSW